MPRQRCTVRGIRNSGVCSGDMTDLAGMQVDVAGQEAGAGPRRASKFRCGPERHRAISEILPQGVSRQSMKLEVGEGVEGESSQGDHREGSCNNPG